MKNTLLSFWLGVYNSQLEFVPDNILSYRRLLQMARTVRLGDLVDGVTTSYLDCVGRCCHSVNKDCC